LVAVDIIKNHLTNRHRAGKVGRVRIFKFNFLLNFFGFLLESQKSYLYQSKRFEQIFKFPNISFY